MCDLLWNQVLSTTDKVKHGVWFVVHFSLVVPLNSFFTSTSDKSFSNDPASLHSTRFRNTEPLLQVKPIGSITFHENSILPIKLNVSFFIVNIHRYLFTIMSRYHELKTFEVLSDYLWRAAELDLMNLSRIFGQMIVSKLLMINEGVTEQETKMVLLVIIIKHGF